MSTLPVDIFRISFDGTREYDTIPMSVFQTGRHFREGWASYDNSCQTIQDMFYNQACERYLLDTFGKYSASTLELYCVKITIIKRVGVTNYASRRVYYGEWKQLWERNGWENAEFKLPTFRYNNPSAKKSALEKMRKLYWWRPQRSLAYANALTVYANIPQQYATQLQNPEYIPNPKYSEYQQKRLDWIKRENPDAWYDIQLNLTSKRKARRQDAQKLLDWMIETSQKYYPTTHRMKPPKPVITREELEEQQRPHKRRRTIDDRLSEF